MTREEAQKLTSFKHYCMCGGFSGMTGRPESRPHLDWCPQRDEHAEWWDAMHGAGAVESQEGAG